MDFKEQFEKTWRIFTGFLPALIINTIALIGISIFTLGILAPVAAAGYMQSLLLAVRENRKPEVGDLFSQMRLFLPLLGFTLAVTIALLLGFAMLVLPGMIMALALVFFCLYMLPLMTDRQMGLIDAVKESSRMALEEPVSEHLAVVALFIGITAVGQSFILGTLFTQPFATIFILLAYEWKTRAGEAEPAQQQDNPTASPEKEDNRSPENIS
jgi:cobalamin synthase